MRMGTVVDETSLAAVLWTRDHSVVDTEDAFLRAALPMPDAAPAAFQFTSLTSPKADYFLV